MTEETLLETRLQQQHMDSDSYDEEEVHYESLKVEGESNTGAGQQSMKHFQPTNKTLSK